MFDLDKWKEIFDTISKNKLRTFLTGFSVAWGIFMLIVLLASGEGLKNGIIKQFGGDAQNTITFYGGNTTIPYKGLKTDRYIQFTNDDYNYIKHHIKGIEYISTTYRDYNTYEVSYKTEHLGYRIIPTMPEHEQLEKMEILQGRFVNQIDIEQMRKVCTIGINVKNALFNQENPLGKDVLINNTFYKVVGVFNDKGREENDRVYTPITVTQKMYGNTNHINQLWVSITPQCVTNTKQIENEIKFYLAKKHNYNINDPNAIYVNNNIENIQSTIQMISGIKVFVTIIGLFTLMSGIIGISNIMTVVVKERTKEIGIRKAIGATPISIILLIMQESVFITFISGVIGMLCGLILIFCINYFKFNSEYFVNPNVNTSVAINALLLIVISGAIAGIIPSRKATKVEVIESLRAD